MNPQVFFLLFFLLLMGANSMAQKNSHQPQINHDNSVTFHLKAPKAQEVILKGSFLPKAKTYNTPAGVFGPEGKVNMRKEKGLWVYTTSILPSEMYTYIFEVDGVQQTDPDNPDSIRDVNEHLSFFIIEGGLADDYIYHDVAHGRVEKIWYDSSMKDMPRRRMSVYFPPQYDVNPSQHFPVLYLLHGSGGDEDAWEEKGRLPQIMDNMIATQRCVPMVVVMPNGIAFEAAAPGSDPNSDKSATATNVESMFGKIETAFVPDIVGYIEKNLRVNKEKSHRAIAGLSLGGLHTLYISANNPDLFDFVGLFSAQTTNALNDGRIKSAEQIAKKMGAIYDLLPKKTASKLGRKISILTSSVNDGYLDIYANLDEKLKRQFQTPPQLYYIALGKDDFVKKLNDDFRLKLADGGYPYTYRETDGGHTWENWRKYLVDFLPRLFTKENKQTLITIP